MDCHKEGFFTDGGSQFFPSDVSDIRITTVPIEGDAVTAMSDRAELVDWLMYHATHQILIYST